MLKIKSFTFNPVRENTYVIYNDEGWCAIIDPGCYFDLEKNDLKAWLDRHFLRPKYLLNTHCHLDHVFGNQFVADTYGLALRIHPLEKPLLDFAPVSGAQWGLPFDPYSGPVQYIEPPEQIGMGPDRLELLFTPGHSPGSLSFYCRDQDFVISGDVLFREGIGRTDLPGGDFDILMKSISNGLFALPDETVIYPGHGPVSRVGHEKEHNPFLRQASR